MPLKLPIYCQLKAIKDFFAFEPDSMALDALLEQNFKQAKNRIDLQDLILNRSKLHLDIDLEDFLILAEADVQNRGLVFSLLDSSQRGNRQLSFEPEIFEFIENEQANLPTFLNPHTLFLLDREKEFCERFEKKYGFWFYNVERLFEKAAFILSSALYNVTKQVTASARLSNWGDLRAFRHPCNAMVIVDNYIFSPNYRQTYQQNIYDNIVLFLKVVLLNNFENIEFDLTFVSEKDSKNRFTIDELYNNLNQKLAGNFTNIYFNLSIIFTNELPPDLQNHDRNIFTNYFWLHSGYSFTYFDNRGNTAKETNLTLHSILGGFYNNEAGDNPIFDAVRLHLDKCKHICDAQTNTDYFRGNKHNRLLDF